MFIEKSCYKSFISVMKYYDLLETKWLKTVAIYNTVVKSHQVASQTKNKII